MKDQYDKTRVMWTKEALSFLAIHYPGGMAMHTICKTTQHHGREVHSKAAKLGLVRRKAIPLKVKAIAEAPRYLSTAQFEAATFDDVLGWLRKHGHKVEQDFKAGLWKVGPFGAQTPQMVVKLANDRRRRNYNLPPFQVDTEGRMPSEISGARFPSLTGSSMDIQIVGVGK